MFKALTGRVIIFQVNNSIVLNEEELIASANFGAATIAAGSSERSHENEDS
jgi:hypothetical protein